MENFSVNEILGDGEGMVWYNEENHGAYMVRAIPESPLHKYMDYHTKE
jgi:hypothetical protein